MTAQEPTILVKKSDGTTERIPMSEFSARTQMSSPPTAPVPVAEPVEAVSTFSDAATAQPKSQATPLPAPTTETHLATTTPVTDAFVDAAAAETHKWNTEDHQSPLTEPPLSRASTAQPTTQMGEAAAVVSSLSFALPNDVHGRLASLITSRQKGIRSDAQFLAYATRETSSGGLGLNATQAEELLGVVAKQYGHEKQAASIPSRKARARKKTNVPKRPPQPVPPSVPTSEPTERAEILAPDQAEINALREKLERTHTATRPKMQDVVPPLTTPSAQPKAAMAAVSPSTSVGPIEEFRTLDREHFMRLAEDPQSAAEMLMQKYMAIQEESYLMGLEVRAAWHKSPLYQSYLDILVASLTPEKDIAAILRETKTFSQEQFEALLQFQTKMH